MRTLAIALAIVGVVGVVPAVASAHGRGSLGERRICSAYRCRTLVATGQVRVFHAEDRAGEYDETLAEWLPTGRVTVLRNEAGFEAGSLLSSRPGVAVSGRFAGYAVLSNNERYPGMGFGEGVARVNVQTGRRQEWGANGQAGSGFGAKSPGVTDVVLTPAGSLAWLIDGSFDDPTRRSVEVTPPGSKAVYLVPSGSAAPVLLAHSATIEPGSLAAVPGHIYWVEAGAAHTFGAP
jgi:hypothetical protein